MKRVNRTNRVHHMGCEEATVLRDHPSGLTRVGCPEQGTVCVTYCVYACSGVCLKREMWYCVLDMHAIRCMCCAHV